MIEIGFVFSRTRMMQKRTFEIKDSLVYHFLFEWIKRSEGRHVIFALFESMKIENSKSFLNVKDYRAIFFLQSILDSRSFFLVFTYSQDFFQFWKIWLANIQNFLDFLNSTRKWNFVRSAVSKEKSFLPNFTNFI